jgi:hypothetical protein
LQNIVWKYDSFDWRVGLNDVTAADVDNNYGFFINNLTTGTFNTVGGIMLTHELNNFTMRGAIKWYPQLKSSFSVRLTPWLRPDIQGYCFFALVLGPDRGRTQQVTAVRGDQLLVAHFPAL